MQKLSVTTLLLACTLLVACGTKSKTQSGNDESTASAALDTLVVTDNAIVNDEDDLPEAGEVLKPLVINIEAPTGKRFLVDNVQKPRGYLTQFPMQKVYQRQVTKKILFAPDEFKDGEYTTGGLISTINSCYDEHRPLVLSPDIVWLAIAQGTAIHARLHMDSLESKIFTADKPEKLVVRNDSLAEGAIHWADFVDTLSKQTKQYTTKDVYSLFVPRFSTTTRIEATAYQVTLLEAYKDVFKYEGETGCGIPYITLTGEKKDWEKIYRKLDDLDQLGLEYWAKELRPIIQEFVNVYDDDVNTLFWQSIYKDYSAYMEHYISGWIIKFYPYMISNEGVSVGRTNDGYDKIKLNYKPNPYLKGSDYLLSTLSTDNLPTGISNIEVTWNNHFTNETTNLRIYSGFFGARQYKDMSLQPIISWIVTNDDIEENNDRSETYSQSTSKEDWLLAYAISSLNKAWIPHLASKDYQLARYNPEEHKTQKASLDELVKYVEGKIAEQYDYNADEIKNIKVALIVLSNGKATRIEVDNCKNEIIKASIQEILADLPHGWKPASSILNNIGDYSFEENAYETSKTMRIDVNSKVSFRLFAKK